MTTSRFFREIPSSRPGSIDENALVQEMQTRIFESSNGVLNDFSPASPLSALTEGQAFATARVSEYLSRLPEAYTTEWLRFLGVEQRIGQTSSAIVTFNKTLGFSSSVRIPAGFKLFTNNNLVFVVDEEVVIPSGSDSAEGLVVSSGVGTQYNVAEYTITRFAVPIVGLDSVYNASRAIGGLSLESLESIKERAQTVLGLRQLISLSDFETEAFDFLGEGYVITAYRASTLEDAQISEFNTDTTNTKTLYLVVSSKDGSLIEQSPLTTLERHLYNRSAYGTQIVALGALRTTIRIKLDIVTLDGTRNQDIAQRAFNTAKSVCSPEVIDIGNVLTVNSLWNVGENYGYVNSVSVSITSVEDTGLEENLVTYDDISDLIYPVSNLHIFAVTGGDIILRTDTNDPGYTYTFTTGLL